MIMCPVCGYDLNEIPWNDNLPSDEICVCCGTHFGYDDYCSGLNSKRETKYSELRIKWIISGCQWFSKSTSKSCYWSPSNQISTLFIEKNKHFVIEENSLNMQQPFGLISVLLDNRATISERDDAAMDLAKYDGSIVEDALLMIVFDTTVNTIIADSASESLSKIWKNRNVNINTIKNIMPKIFLNYYY